MHRHLQFTTLLLTLSFFPSAVSAQVSFSPGFTVADGFTLGFINRFDRLAVADLDGDGLQDLVYNTGYGEIYWSRNRGGVFDNPVLLLNRSDSMYQIRAADMDGDGDQDLVFQTADEAIMVMKNKGDGTFLEPAVWNWKYSTFLSDFRLADFDNDGDTDILMLANQFGDRVWYSKNDGTGEAEEECYYSPVHDAWFCDLQEVDFLNYTNVLTDPVRDPQWAAPGDFDGNGSLDVVIGSSSTSDAVVGALDVSRNDGSGGFTLHDFITPQIQEIEPERSGGLLLFPYDPINVQSLKAAPIDNQPGDEVIATGWMRIPDASDPYSFELWELNEGLFYWTRPGGTLNGSGAFERRQIGPTTADFMYHFDVADFDQDGDNDVVGLWGSGLVVAGNDGAGGFSDADRVYVDAVNSIMNIATGDLDGDGKPEIILYDYDSFGGSVGIKVYYNTSGTPTPFHTWIRTNHPGLSVVDQMPGADPDGDGNDNETEFGDGTDPTDASSFVPHLLIESGPGSVTHSPNMAVYGIGDVVTLTPVPPAGYFFMGWTGDRFSMDETLTVTLNRSISLEAHFFPDFDDPVENPGLLWRTGGDAPWAVTASKGQTGGDSIMSGAITHNQTSWVEATVRGSGTIRFWWWVSTDNDEDPGRFLIDGNQRYAYAGPNVQWFQEEVYIAESGEHVLRWQYDRDGSGSMGSNRVWLDGVEWIPDEPSYADWASFMGLWPDPAYAGYDGNGNGVADVFEYSLDLPLDSPGNGMPSLAPAAAPGGVPGLRFRLPVFSVPDRVLKVAASPNLSPGTWTTIATKQGDGSWFGTGAVEEVSQPDGSTEVTVRGPWSLEDRPSLFLRLEAGVED